ncbi:MAG: PqqD family protein [Deltaproteobacteria bacterium]|jgi:hypothetical protein
MVDFARTFIPTDHARATEIDGEAVILNLDTEVYYSLNATGSEVWRVLEARRPLQEAVAAICTRFDAGETQVRDDVTRLVRSLLDAGLVIEASSS